MQRASSRTLATRAEAKALARSTVRCQAPNLLINERGDVSLDDAVLVEAHVSGVEVGARCDVVAAVTIQVVVEWVLGGAVLVEQE
jgi:hypothetical protein